MSPSNNHVTGSILNAGGDIHVGDNVNNFAQEPEQAILFLRISPREGGHVAELFVRAEAAVLAERSLALLPAPIALPDLHGLFSLVKDFERERLNPSERLRSLQARPSPAALENRISEEIFQRCFANAVGRVIQDFLTALAAKKLPGLLLVIASPDPAVRDIPWEMVLDRLRERAPGFAQQALGMDAFALVRTMEQDLDQFKLRAAAPQAGPLKLLFVTALPEDMDEEAKFLAMEAEQQKLIRAVGHLEATGDSQPKMVVEFLDVASLAEIRKAIVTRQHDIIHISGHGGLDPDTGRGLLLLEDEDGNQRPTSGEELADALHGHDCRQLVVLSACETAHAGVQASIAEALAAAGVPAVLAMRFAVSDEGAQVFTTALYTRLADGGTLAAAMAHGRDALYQKVTQARQQQPQSPFMAEWMTPVLVLNQCVGRLLDPRLPYLLPARFYTHSVFDSRTDESHDPGLTRLIGEGFIGRKYPRIRLRRCFQADPPQHVCLVGMGGMGKTTLAEAFAHHYDQGSHKVLIWRRGVQLTSHGILDRIAAAAQDWGLGERIVRLAEAKVKDDKCTPLDKLKWLTGNCLKARPHILIFDNLEDLQAIEVSPEARQIGRPSADGEEDPFSDHRVVAELLDYLLNHAPHNGHILLTTRYVVEGLRGPLQHIHLHPLTYAEHYRLMNMDTHLRKIGDAERLRVYQRLGGLPRAYHFLAALAAKPGFRWQALDAELEEVTADVFADLLLGKLYDLLDPDQKTLFLQASVFFTRSPLAALAHVSGWAEAALRAGLEALRAWSLCLWEGEEFEVHALTREWVRQEGLLEEEERKRVAFGAGEYFRDLPTMEDEALAVEYFEQAEAWEDFAKAALRLQIFFQDRAFYDKAMKLCERVLKNVQSPYYIAAALGNKGKVLFHQGHYEEAVLILEQSLQIEIEIGNREGESVVLNNLATIKSAQGDNIQALALWERSLAIQQEIGDRKEESTTLNNLSQHFQAQGDYPKALAYLERCLQIRHEIGDRSGEGVILNNLGGFHFEQADYPKALGYFEKSLPILQEIGDRAVEAATLGNLGQIYSIQGDFPKALDYVLRSLHLQREIGNRAGECVTCTKIGQLYQAQSDYPAALEYLGHSLLISQEIGDRALEGSALNSLGQVYDALADYAQALGYLERSLSIQQEIANRRGEGGTLNSLGQVHQAKGDSAKALDYLERSLLIMLEIGDRAGEGVVLGNLSQVYQTLGDYAMALDYLERSLLIMQEIGDLKGEGTTLNNLGQFLLVQGEYAKALSHFERSLLVANMIGDRAGEGVALNNLAGVAHAQGEYTMATELLERSLQIRREISDRAGAAATLNNLGQIFEAQGRHDTAREYLQLSLIIIQEIGDRAGEGAVLNNLGEIHKTLGDFDAALRYLERSLIIRYQVGDMAGLAATFFNLGMISFDQDDYEGAVPYLLHSYSINHQLGSPNQQHPASYLKAIQKRIGEAQFQAIVAKIDPNNLPSLNA